jgi:hypothetical protein
MNLHKNQSGLVSIIITMILIFVMSLIVMSFFRVSQRNQRQALDRQLNTQAFYAAESGINDAKRLIDNAVSGGNPIPEKSDCGQMPGLPDQTINEGIGYSCLLIDPSPGSLSYDLIEKGTSKVVNIERSTAFNTITVAWEENGVSSPVFDGCPSGPNIGSFPSVWHTDCSAGIMRIDLVPIPSTPFSRNDLINNTMTGFFVPIAGIGVSNFDFSSARGMNNQGAVRLTRCNAANAPRRCRIRIDINITPTQSRYMARFTPLYKNASLTICSPNCEAPEDLIGEQVVIDSTGRSADILKRLQARVRLSAAQSVFPVNALETSESICKRFTYDGTTISDTGTCAVFDP